MKKDESQLLLERWLIDAVAIAKDEGKSEGFTKRELLQKARNAGISIGNGRLGRLLREAVENGTLIAKFGERKNVLGIPYAAPIYCLVDDNETKE
jgi:hypothetical protein